MRSGLGLNMSNSDRGVSPNNGPPRWAWALGILVLTGNVALLGWLNEVERVADVQSPVGVPQTVIYKGSNQ
jgi:hypothetical protein